jgi:hypothetical protein
MRISKDIKHYKKKCHVCQILNRKEKKLYVYLNPLAIQNIVGKKTIDLLGRMAH